jgi:uncharacterized protein (TIGR03663 family)
MSQPGADESASPGPCSRLRTLSVGLRDRFERPVLVAVLTITLLSFSIRTIALDGRIFHWDEARVGYWILRYGETGELSYRPIIHGPFVQVVNEVLFDLFGFSDTVARLPVAVVGAVLPLFAWLVRDRLDDVEVVALALLLAFNPLLVYYSRFMRSDVLVAGFALLALGLIVRGIDVRRPSYLVPAGAMFGLAFTAKENALVYLLCFLGAGVLLLDHRIVREVWAGRRLPAVVIEGTLDASDRLAAWLAAPTPGDTVSRFSRRRVLSLLLSPPAGLLFGLAVIVFFYAPRPALWGVAAEPGTARTVFYQATVVAGEEFMGTWGGGGHQVNDYLPYLFHLLKTLVYGAPVVIVFALVGIAVDWYGPTRPRGLVAFATYVAVVSLVGYPEGSDIRAPWIAVHVLLLLTIPAAVGVAAIVREWRRSIATENLVGAALAALILVAAAGGVVWLNADYFNSTDPDDEILQYAQPHNDLQQTVDDAVAVSDHNEGVDVLFYGTTSPTTDSTLFYVENESSLDSPPPGGPSWHSRLPLPWYFERADATLTSSRPDAEPAAVTADATPVVVAHDWDRDELEPHLDGYEAREHYFRLWSVRVVFFIETDALERAEQAEQTRQVEQAEQTRRTNR